MVNQRQNYNQSVEITYEEYASQLLEKQKHYESMMVLMNQLYDAGKKKGVLSRLRYKLNKQVRNRIRQEEDAEDEQTYWKHRDEQIKELVTSKCSNCDLKPKHLKQLERKQEIKDELDQLKEKVDENDIAQQQDFVNRVQVLKVLGYIDENDVGLIKSRVARELQDNSSIYITEVLVENIMDGLKPSKVAGLLSGFVCQWKGSKDDHNFVDYDELPFDLGDAMKRTSQLVRRIIEEESNPSPLPFPRNPLRGRRRAQAVQVRPRLLPRLRVTTPPPIRLASTSGPRAAPSSRSARRSTSRKDRSSAPSSASRTSCAASRTATP